MRNFIETFFFWRETELDLLETDGSLEYFHYQCSMPLATRPNQENQQDDIQILSYHTRASLIFKNCLLAAALSVFLFAVGLMKRRKKATEFLKLLMNHQLHLLKDQM